MDRPDWLILHPYLAQLAEFQAAVEAAASGTPPLAARPEAWRSANARGTAALREEPLRSEAIEAGAAALARLVDRLETDRLPQRLAEGVLGLRETFRSTPADARHIVGWLVGGGAGEDSPQAGLLRFLGWSALAAALAPAIRASEPPPEDGARWTGPTCPTCGAHPVMAVLVPRGEGRERRLVCGLCRTRWGYRRIGCPYCENDDPARLELFEIASEPGLRLDTCRACMGYVKTVTAEDAPAFLADDWSTVHLDALARDKGYKRLGPSLYDL
jgi:FdhE protein